eukprot:1107621-Amorphochlora_amoeboformis.AAC.1
MRKTTASPSQELAKFARINLASREMLRLAAVDAEIWAASVDWDMMLADEKSFLRERKNEFVWADEAVRQFTEAAVGFR